MNSFFIVLQGLVSIYVCTDLEPGKLAGVIETNKEEKSSFRQSQDGENEMVKQRLDRKSFGKHIVQLGIGASFGELALINDDSVRNASIILDEPTQLIVIDRDLYNRSLKGFQKRDFEDRNNFVEKHPLFQQWPWRIKRQVAMSLERSTVDFDGFIARQGKQVTALNFIFKGFARLIFNHACLYSTTSGHIPTPSIQYDMGKYSKRKNRIDLDHPSNHKQRQVEICSISNGEAIGDFEILYPLDHYLFSTVAAAQTEILSLSVQNMSRFLENKTIQKMQTQLLCQAFFRLCDRVYRSIDDPILIGIFDYAKLICELAVEKKNDALERMRRAQLRKQQHNNGGKSPNGGLGARHTTSLDMNPKTPITPASNAFRRFVSQGGEDDTTLHYAPHVEESQFDDDFDVPHEALEAVFPDWETSDKKLTELEARIRRFNTEVVGEADPNAAHVDTKQGHKKSAHKVVEMRRYTISGHQGAPRAGTLVKVRLNTNSSHPVPTAKSRNTLTVPEQEELIRQRSFSFGKK